MLYLMNYSLCRRKIARTKHNKDSLAIQTESVHFAILINVIHAGVRSRIGREH